MKLRTPDWKTAWFENHISDRFFQEMAKLEKGTVMNLETSAQWMEQIMIEVGQLAQAMIRLEGSEHAVNQIRQATEKALRLSALAVHLTTGLDQSQRTHDWPVQATQQGMGYHPAPPAPLSQEPASSSSSVAPSNRPTSATTGGNKGPVMPGGFSSPFPPVTLDLGKGAKSAPAAQSALPKAVTPAPTSPEPAQGPLTETEEQKDVLFDGPLLSGFMDVGEDESVEQGSPMRQTILSLSVRGLSRAEIEVITGQPRHIIEAVLAEG